MKNRVRIKLKAHEVIVPKGIIANTELVTEKKKLIKIHFEVFQNSFKQRR